jgi:hypothetical protein
MVGEALLTRGFFLKLAFLADFLYESKKIGASSAYSYITCTAYSSVLDFLGNNFIIFFTSAEKWAVRDPSSFSHSHARFNCFFNYYNSSCSS